MPLRRMSCSVGLLGRSRQDVQVPGTHLDTSLNGPLLPGLFGALGMGEPPAPSGVRGDPRPGHFLQCGLPTTWTSQLPCGSGWFSQTIHLGEESREILQPGGLRKAWNLSSPETSRAAGVTQPLCGTLPLSRPLNGWLPGPGAKHPALSRPLAFPHSSSWPRAPIRPTFQSSIPG